MLAIAIGTVPQTSSPVMMTAPKDRPITTKDREIPDSAAFMLLDATERREGVTNNSMLATRNPEKNEKLK